jgi:hypothetical protein
MSTPKEHFGFVVSVNPDGTPKVVKVRKRPPPPVKTPSTRAFMRQENEDGSGKYFGKRKLAFESETSRWLILYETKQLKLMNSGFKYANTMFNTRIDASAFTMQRSLEDDSLDVPNEFDFAELMKSTTHILELSVPVHYGGRMSLESLCWVSQKSSKRGRFLVVPPGVEDAKKIFQTDFVGTPAVYPVMRQCSDDHTKTNDFRVTCRPIMVENIDIIFIVHHKSVHLALPEVINKQVYTELLKIENVLLFKQLKI